MIIGGHFAIMSYPQTHTHTHTRMQMAIQSMPPTTKTPFHAPGRPPWPQISQLNDEI